MSTPIDAVVIGAGFGGLAATHRLAQRGLNIVAIERAHGVGGTWYWNRYPGARTDSEGSFYRLNFFDDEVEPFSFTEKFPSQPEVLSYLERVATELDLHKHYRFGVSVESLTFDDETDTWAVRTSDGDHITARYVVSAVGIQSEPLVPQVPGRETFTGRVYHTAAWPQEPVDLDGCRVAVIGTGSSGIQVLPQVAARAAQVYVLQRTPNYSVPMVNAPLDAEQQQELIASLPQIRETVRAHPFSMPYAFSAQSALAVDEAERQRVYEQAWAKGGFRFMIESFNDIGADEAANATASEFLRGKIREIVADENTAALLTPDYPYSVKRPPSGVEFFESFNLDHVELLDIRSTALSSFTERGLALDGRELDVDVVIFATGFDFVTGSLYKLNMRGRDGLGLADRWADELSIYLSMAVHGFPNLFMIGGPHYPGGNWPTTAEQCADFIAGLISTATARGATRVEVDETTEKSWVAHVNEVAAQSLMYKFGTQANSYGMGANIDGKINTVFFYLGGAQVVFDKMDAEAAEGYPGFEIA